MQTQVTVPWQANYDFGIGVDLSTGSPMGRAVVGETSGVTASEGAKTAFQISRITSTSDLETALGISVEASGGCGCFSASARMDYAKSTKVQSGSLFMLITARVELENLSIDDPSLSPAALALAGTPDAFATRFGNMFVRGIARGGLFIATLRFDTASSEESEAISAELSGSYGAFSADAKMHMESVQKQFHSELFISVYHEGGPVDLTMDDIQDGNQLYVMLQHWLESFQTDPAKNSVPYTVTLAPIAIANGPIPPNAAEIQHAQDVLVVCARKRSDILDGLNLMDYVAQHASRYEFVAPTTPADLAAASDGYQADLDVVGAAASYAINNVALAATPADFAAKSGLTFPRGLPPVPFPTLQLGGSDTLAKKGEMMAAADPLLCRLRDQQPEGEGRRGFFLGLAVAEHQTADGPGKAAVHDGLPAAEQQGFSLAVAFSLARNRAADAADRGAAVVAADPAVEKVADANSNVFYCLGFQVGTGIYGDPALGAIGNTATGPGGFAVRDALGSPDAVRGFNDAVRFHLGPPLRPRR
jgi:hypothetical protein